MVGGNKSVDARRMYCCERRVLCIALFIVLFSKWSATPLDFLYYINVKLAALRITRPSPNPLLKSGLFEDGVARLEKRPEGGDG
jgi:hypothetical protein